MLRKPVTGLPRGALHSKLSPAALWVLPGCWIDSLLLCQSSCSHFMTICLSMECLFSAFQYIPNRSSVLKTRLDTQQSRNILPSLTAPYQILWHLLYFLLFNILICYYIFYVYKFCLRVCLCTRCMPGAYRGVK